MSNVKRYYANLKGKADESVCIEVRRLTDGIYDLCDRTTEVDSLTLNKDVSFNRDLVGRKFRIVIARQDNAGGHSIVFNSKFKGVSGLIPSKIGGSTEVYLFWEVSPAEALLVSFQNY